MLGIDPTSSESVFNCNREHVGGTQPSGIKDSLNEKISRWPRTRSRKTLLLTPGGQWSRTEGSQKPDLL